MPASSETDIGATDACAVAGTPGPARLGRSSSVPDEGRFPPGTVLAQRYRIAGRLGKGGMGEVYKATDLLLGQVVALKFLPETLVNNEAMLDRFRNEVRLARQVSHPNVCRVYDIGEASGQLFLTMEFIDGEDLAGLLRRIGQLPSAKALEIARRLCAGLAAAHEKGVLHRDLKPANVMLDARGQVLITDFGLAAAEDSIKPEDVRSGTPAYMAPEQLAGREVTARSDIYAFGLVLYEMFTGRQPFEAKSLDELRDKQRAGPGAMTGVDEQVERAIARCLEYDPKRRAATALAVAAALPGGDPLAAALAAGETPSPEAVAGAGEREVMRRWLGLACFASLVVGMLVMAGWEGRSSVLSQSGAQLSPDRMAQKASDILSRLGYADVPVFADWAYTFDFPRFNQVMDMKRARRSHAGGRASPLAEKIAESRFPAVYFWYRVDTAPPVSSIYSLRVSEDDPQQTAPGSIRLRLDAQGRLTRLYAIPPAAELPETTEGAAAFDWELLFAAASLRLSDFQSAAPISVPPSAFDARRAWVGAAGSERLYIEAATWRLRPVYFRIRDEAAARASTATRTPQKSQWPNVPLLFVVPVVAVFVLAWRNYRLQRGDPRRASRLGVAMGVASFLCSMLAAVHPGEWRAMFQALALAIYDGALAMLFYFAVEPYVRRRWPQVLISSTRLLSRNARDPLVGRHVLIGLAFAPWLMLLASVAEWAGLIAQPHSTLLPLASGWPGIASAVLLTLPGAVNFEARMLVMFLLLGLPFPLRYRSKAVFFAGLTLCFVLGPLILPFGGPAWARVLGVVIAFGVEALLLFRFGLLAAVACRFGMNMAGFRLPLTFDTGAWYFPASAAAILVTIGLSYWAMRTALAGQPLWKEEP